MSWNNIQNNQLNADKQYAVDWAAKLIPTAAYENCIAAKESYVSALKGMAHEHLTVAKNKFIVSIIIFFDTVETGFISYMDRPTQKKDEKDKTELRPLFMFNNNPITKEDYFLLLGDTKAIDEKKLFVLFRILKNWAFELGPLNTSTPNDKDVFEAVEMNG